jgi:cytochrome c oxidase subunit 2
MLWGLSRERERHEDVEGPDWPPVAGIGGGGAALVTGGAAFAEMGQPAPWEYTLQEAATPVMENIIWFHNFLFWLITIITLFVLALLVIVVVKFNAKANPVPSRTTHNTLIEVAWTLIPVLILVGIAVPSFRLLFQELDIPKADLTIKATGKQWYWSYAYPDNGKFEFDSLLAQDKKPRLLGVDNEMVVPVNKVVRVQTTGADVIHSFAVPAFGIKIDAIPGRLNETWFKATRQEFGPGWRRFGGRGVYSTNHKDIGTPMYLRVRVYSTNHKDIGTMYLVFASSPASSARRCRSRSASS